MKLKLCAIAFLVVAATPLAAEELLLNETPLSLKDFGREGAWFGKSVALSHDSQILVAGAAQSGTRGTRSGAVHVFTLQPSGDWERDGDFPETASDTAAFDAYGYSVAISGNGNVIAVGAPLNDESKGNAGAVYIWGRSGEDWVFLDKVTAGGARANDQLGTSVALNVDGSLLVAGAPQPDPVSDPSAGPSGKILFFELQGNVWQETKSLPSPKPEAYAFFGFAVAVGGERGSVVAVGAPGAANQAGAAYLFVRSADGIWNSAGDRTGTNPVDEFGSAVAVDAKGDTVVVGARNALIKGNGRAGAVYVFNRASFTAEPQQSLEGSDSAAHFGGSVTIDPSGRALLVGVPILDGTGKAFVFRRAGNNWRLALEVAPCSGGDTAAFGESLAISDLGQTLGTVAVGAPKASGETGMVCIFDMTGLAPSIELDQSASVVPGRGVRYKIIVRNRSSRALSKVPLVVEFDESRLTSVVLECEGCAQRRGEGTLNVELPGLQARGQAKSDAVLFLTAQVRPEARGALDTVVRLVETSEAIDLTLNESMRTDALKPEIILDLDKSVDKTFAFRGEALRYTITVSNTGASRTVGTTLIDAFPSSTTAISWTCRSEGGAECEKLKGSGRLKANLSLPSGGKVVYEATASIRADASLAPVINTALLRDVDQPGEKRDPAITTIKPQANLEVRFEENLTAVPGDPFVLAARVINNGPDAVDGARITGSLAGIDVVWSCGGKPGVSEVSLSKGESTLCEARDGIRPDARGEIRGEALVTAPASVPDPNLDNNEARVSISLIAKSKLILEWAPDSPPDNVAPGEPIEYEFTLRNEGPSDLLGGTLSGSFPSLVELSLIRIAAGSGDCGTFLTGEFSDRVELPRQRDIEYKVCARVPSELRGIIETSVEIEPDLGESVLSTAPLTTTTTLKPKSKIFVGLAADRNRVFPDESPLTYFLLIKNNGPSDLLAASLKGRFSEAVITSVTWHCGTFDLTGRCNSGFFPSGDAVDEDQFKDEIELPAGSIIQYVLKVQLPLEKGSLKFEVDLRAGKYQGEDENVTLDALSVTESIVLINPDGGG